ncbi:RICIN domain-containing protein [Amycolatopsis sp. H20-H5]|uniref:RICIN domain-containing protein n=1 Tax=Amycolatopsis sp. H20-H5 TaxID=3046309 RepID=UPI002DBB9FCE|nr:ricin-type beta-trefoil lectin domain protein [Amycolatopsis sp. H20-H5]MEC3975272.1 ricin-type beta-trefoil lectin domain protein [Amycolatopsis sp. H20-H5]
MKRTFLPLFGAALITAAALATPAQAAGETVNVWLTTTNDARGVNVTRGLQQQAPVAFTAGTGSGGQTINVNENTQYQQFEGGGASFTDTAAYLMNSSGALSQATRDDTMRKLFDPNSGIGLSFLRNPLGSSDLARNSHSFDDLPAGQTDPNLANFSIAHDLTDVLPLTKQAKQLNPAIKVMASPWSAPPWMKDNGSFKLGWLKSEYYAAYAQYFTKYIQAYQAQGVPINYLTVQNEPTCCDSYPSMNWNGAGLAYFTKTNLLPALHSTGLSTKVLSLDWNWDKYTDFAAPTMDDPAIRNDPNFGGMAWHGYGGNVGQQTTVHNQYPTVPAFSTEHSGGTWASNQQAEDMSNIVDYTRNWSKSFIKWSLAVDQNMGPHTGGCGTCTGFITVHNGDSRSGQVDYTVEYYTMGHLTKFVKPGAYRIDSNDGSAVRNVAWKNPDGSKALIAYNTSGASQNVRVNWGGQSFSYTLPAATSATFTWGGTQTGGGGGTGAITGLGGKCADVAGASSTNGSAVQLYDCNGTPAQQWTVGTDGTVKALGKCLDVTGASTTDGAPLQLWDCTGGPNQKWTANGSKQLVNTGSGKCMDATGNTSANGTRLQIWTCASGANQQWTLPTGDTTPPTPGPGAMAVAPYIYNGWGNPPSATTVMASTGVKWFTMAFILSNGYCNPMWDGGRGLTGGVDQNTVNAVRGAGGDVIPSFGGYSGNKLESSCSSAGELAAGYQKVINAYGLKAIDIDIEADAYSNGTVQQRTVDALKTIRANNAGIKIYVTFDTGQSGPDNSLVNRAASSGLTVDGWTIMPFDFGGAGQNMGNLTMQAAEGLKNVVKSAYAYSDDMAYRHMGISSMNGITDNNETVTLNDFTTILGYANQHHLARLTFWSANRDRPCPAGYPNDDTCSGVSQQAWDFTRIFARYAG